MPSLHKFHALVAKTYKFWILWLQVSAKFRANTLLMQRESTLMFQNVPNNVLDSSTDSLHNEKISDIWVW